MDLSECAEKKTWQCVIVCNKCRFVKNKSYFEFNFDFSGKEFTLFPFMLK